MYTRRLLPTACWSLPSWELLAPLAADEMSGKGFGLASAVLALACATLGHALHSLDASLVLGNASFPHTSVGPYSWKYYTGTGDIVELNVPWVRCRTRVP